MDQHFRAALKLHQYLVCRHWREQGLIGPDSGIRFNYRVGRFVKSYLRFIPWHDEYYYLQAQSYWALSNWRLFALTHEETYRQIAVRCSALMLTRQRPDGAWVYPNREWKGRIATAEGTWGALSLLETYRNTGDPTFLLGALRWHQFLVKNIGWQQIGKELAINYFANQGGSRIANNSAFVLRFLVELADLTGDKTYLQPCDGLLTFLQRVQEPTGEFPYAVTGTIDDESRLHFQCYQYNAFQCLDLMKYYEMTREAVPLTLITKVLGFLRQGLAGDGQALYACGASAWHREVTYHTAALAAAFVKAEQLSVGGYGDLAVRAYAHLLDLQRPDGSFPHSQRDYLILKDQRPYPRNLSMILYHLLSTQED